MTIDKMTIVLDEIEDVSMTLTKMEAILSATWHEGEECRECAHRYVEYMPGRGSVHNVLDLNGCHVVEGDKPIEECPAVRRAMEDAQ